MTLPEHLQRFNKNRGENPKQKNTFNCIKGGFGMELDYLFQFFCKRFPPCVVKADSAGRGTTLDFSVLCEPQRTFPTVKL